jgi:hypothetical protein
MTFGERRRPAFDEVLLIRVGLAWALVCAVLLLTSIQAIATRRFPDPDDILRLVQVRDLIGGQGWFDLTQHRIDAAHGGVAMHWSRLVDLPIAAMILLLSPVLGTALAEQVAVIAIPLLTLGIAMLMAARIAWRLIGEEAATFTCLVMAMSVPLVMQLRPLRIDHHGWQVVAALAAVNGLMARSPHKGGWAAGLALAAGLAISLEGLPFAAAVAAVLALRWLRDRTQRAWLPAMMQGLATGSTALFLLTRGLGDLANHCDALAPVHLAALGWGAGILTLLARPRALPIIPTLLGFAIAGGGAMAIVLGTAPQCASGTFTMIDPVVRQFWLQNIAEGLPLWRQEPSLVLQILVPILMGLFACLRLAHQSRQWLRAWWYEYALLLIAALLVATFVARAAALAGALAAVPLGWQVLAWLKAARRPRRRNARPLALALIVLCLAPATPLTLLSAAAPGLAHSNPSAPKLAVPQRASSCRIADVASQLDRLPAGAILAPLDIGPQLLLQTRHSVVATSHHRAGPAMRSVIDAFAGPPGQALAIARRDRLDYLAICPDLAEPMLYSAAPQGLAAQLRAGQVPAWLAPIPLSGSTTLQVYRILR